MESERLTERLTKSLTKYAFDLLRVSRSKVLIVVENEEGERFWAANGRLKKEFLNERRIENRSWGMHYVEEGGGEGGSGGIDSLPFTDRSSSLPRLPGLSSSTVSVPENPSWSPEPGPSESPRAQDLFGPSSAVGSSFLGGAGSGSDSLTEAGFLKVCRDDVNFSDFSSGLVSDRAASLNDSSARLISDLSKTPVETSCLLCGERSHVGSNCPILRRDFTPSVICHKCNAPGHKSPDCPFRKIGGKNDNQKGIVCHKCNASGHKAPDCPLLSRMTGRNKDKDADVICHKCKLVGHRVQDCPQRRKNKLSRNIRSQYFAPKPGGIDEVIASLGLCFKCGNSGHKPTECPGSNQSKDRNDPKSGGSDRRERGSPPRRDSSSKSRKCYNCNSSGHERSECPRLAQNSSGKATDDRRDKSRELEPVSKRPRSSSKEAGPSPKETVLVDLSQDDDDPPTESLWGRDLPNMLENLRKEKKITFTWLSSEKRYAVVVRRSHGADDKPVKIASVKELNKLF